MKFRLGDICTITKGATGIMKAIPGPYTMIALGETDKTHIEYQFDTKAVIIPLVSSTGHGHASMKRVKYSEGKFALGNILCAVTPNDESFVLAKYLHIYLHWNREELLVSQMKGMANVSLPMNRIADVMVAVPSIEKQREIIELEKQLVKKEIEADKLFADQLTQLENLNQAILQEAVQGKLVKQDPKDEPAIELLKRIKAEKAKSSKKEKPLPPIKMQEIPFEIPENWMWRRLGEIIFDTEGGKSPYCLNENVTGEEWGVIKTTAVQQMMFLEDENKILPRGFKISEQHKIVVDDVLITRAGPKNRVGIVCCVTELSKNLILSDKTIRFRHPMHLIYSRFLAIVYNAPKMKSIITSKMVGMAQSQVNISQDSMKTFLFPLPPLPEQKRIVAEIEKQLAKTKQLKEHILDNQQATAQLLKALLHQAFEVENKNADQKPVEQTKGKVIELKPTNVDYYRRTVLAAEIVWQLHKEPTLGHLKLQKLIYLCQKSTDMQLPTNFLRQAMGPYDNKLMRSVDKQLKEKKWFEYKKEQVLKYQPLEKAGQHHNDFLKYFSAEKDSIQFIIDTFKTRKSDIVEIVATLYACIENILTEKAILSEALVIQRFYEWSEEKKKFNEEQVKRILSRMSETGIIPNGFNIYNGK
jgi:type I restriction enzyme S subunit